MELEERIRELEEEIHNTQKNKATERHIGLLKARIAHLRELEKKQSKKRKVVKGIRKSGDATCSISGPPSVGKSTLINRLTSVESRVAEYDFTTLKVIEGMMIHKGAHIQLLDTPGLIGGAAKGKGRGREVLSSLRMCDLTIIILDPSTMDKKGGIEKELYDAGMRLNRKRPNIRIKKTDRGGTEVFGYGDKEFVKDLAREYGILNAKISVGKGSTTEDVIDFFSGNVHYTKALWFLNKVDNGELDVKGFDLQISAKYGKNMEKLKDLIFERLDLIRVYTDTDTDTDADKEPMVLKKGSTVRDFCRRIHRDFEEKFRFARIWGSSVRYDGQLVGLGHVLNDEDTIKVEIKR